MIGRRAAGRFVAVCCMILALWAAAGAPAQTPPEAALVDEFADSRWRYCEVSCAAKVYYHRIHLRADGIVGYQRDAGDPGLDYEGGDSWRIEGRTLIIRWTSGYSTDQFDVGAGGEATYAGVHSRVVAPSVIERVTEE